MSATYCALKLTHNTCYHYSSMYRGAVDFSFAQMPSSALATCHKVIYFALDAIPKLALVSVPTTVMFLRGFSFDDISPAFIGASTWILFSILSVFYPCSVLTNLNDSVQPGRDIPNLPVIEKMVTFLGDGSSILLHGPTGSGKSAAIRALVELINSDKCPPALKNKQILSLNLEEMLADHHEFLKNLVAVLKVVRLNPHAILCVDEIHRLSQSIHGIKISDTLKLYFEREGSQGKNIFIQAIGVTTTEERDKMMGQEIAFLRRFISVGMPAEDEKLSREVIQRRFDSKLSEEVVTLSMATAREYLPRVALPASAIQVLEIVSSWKKRNNSSAEITVADIRSAIDQGYIE